MAASIRDYKTITEIREIREETRKKIGARLGKGVCEGAELHMMICGSTGCSSSGSGKLLDKLDELMARDGLEEKVAVVPGTAFGDCGEGYLRISYAYCLENLKVAIGRLEHFVKKLRAER